MRAVHFANMPVAQAQKINFLAGSGGQVKRTVKAFAMLVSKMFSVNIRYGEMSRVERVCQKPQGKEPETVEIRPAFEEDQFKAESSAGIRLAMPGVIPPFGLNISMGV